MEIAAQILRLIVLLTTGLLLGVLWEALGE